MTKTIIAQGAGLGGDGDGPAAGVLGQVGHTATVEILGQQGSSISRVPQGAGRPLHVGEGADEGGGVRDVVDGGRLYTEPGDRHGDLTVGVALVRLSDNLVDVAGDVGRDRFKVCSVLEINADKGSTEYSSGDFIKSCLVYGPMYLILLSS